MHGQQHKYVVILVFNYYKLYYKQITNQSDQSQLNLNFILKSQPKVEQNKYDDYNISIKVGEEKIH